VILRKPEINDIWGGRYDTRLQGYKNYGGDVGGGKMKKVIFAVI